MKKWFAVLCIAMMMLMAVGCQASGEDAVTEEAPAVSEAAEAAETSEPAEEVASEVSDAHYPVTIKNYNRNKDQIDVTFDKAPERVVVAYQNGIEIMLALGLEDRIVAATGIDHEVKAEFADAFAQVTYYDKGITKEEVMGLEPDFILSWYSFFGDKKMGDVDFWHERGVNTYMMENSGAQPNKDLAHEYQDIRAIGQIFDVEDKAEALIAEIEAKVAEGQAFAAAKDPVKAVVLEIGKEGTYRIYGEDSVGGNMASMVGAELVGKESGNIGAEDLVAMNPDVIFSVYYAYYGNGVEEEFAVNGLMENEGLQSISAIQSGRVHSMKLGEVYCSGIRTMDGVDTMLKGLYPDEYEK
jgi:iron complex transport system substrate-binding protein